MDVNSCGRAKERVEGRMIGDVRMHWIRVSWRDVESYTGRVMWSRNSVVVEGDVDVNVDGVCGGRSSWYWKEVLG